jgi:uncharacterized protein YecT (DUF1311 family)
MSEARDAVDSRLNAVYKSVRDKLDAAHTQRLITAERQAVKLK